jgi:hypothetical protein
MRKRSARRWCGGEGGVRITAGAGRANGIAVRAEWRGREMSDDEPLSFEEARRRRDDNPSLVPCARCGRRILATVTRCPACGIHFQGAAQEFTHESEREPPAGAPAWVVVLAVLVLAAMLLGMLLK